MCVSSGIYYASMENRFFYMLNNVSTTKIVWNFLTSSDVTHLFFTLVMWDCLLKRIKIINYKSNYRSSYKHEFAHDGEMQEITGDLK